VPALPETHIRPQLLRLAVLPPIAVALSASAAVLFTVRSTGARTSLTLWGVLAGATSVTCAGILIAAVAAGRAASSVSDRIGALRRSSARGEADLRDLVEALRRGEGPPQRKPRSRPPGNADDFDLLAADLAHAHDGAVTAVVSAAQLSSQAGSEQKVEVFVNLARRLQSLVHREISILDELENEIEDPDLLKGLFHVDHLATRIRRHAENLAVLGGAVSRRQWSNPVSMTEVLRSAIAEVEQYSRVKLVPPIDGTLRGHAVADVIHLLAELVENATVFSAPHTQVLLRANLVTSGLAVEVEDRGLGMPVGEQSRMNALLTDPDQVNVASLLADGRIGLFVVSQLARRHGIHVRLQTNIYGGVQAVLVVPQALLGTAPGELGAMGQPDDTMGGGRPLLPPQQSPQGGAQGAAQGGTEGGRQAAGRRGAPASVPAVPGRHQRESGAPGRHQRRDSVPPAAPGPNGSGPVPLPVRGARAERANPAEAVPGIRPDDRQTVAANTTTPPAPRGGTVRGTMGKPPQLPRRRAQEHIAPQLRDGPAPRQDSEHPAGHDPGLMAAFQRGIGLAEAQQHMEAADMAEGTDLASPHMEPLHVEAPHMEPLHMEAPHTDVPHMESAHVDSLQAPAAHAEPHQLGSVDTGSVDMGSVDMGSAHMDAAHTAAAHTATDHTEFPHTNGVHTGGVYMSPSYTGPTPLDPSLMEPFHMSATHMGSDHMDTAPRRHDPQPTTPDIGTGIATGTGTGTARSAAANGTDRFLLADRTSADHISADHTSADHTEMPPLTLAPHMDATPIAEAHAHAPGHDLTARHDGSASAG
jgi:signal transduction histidine kinase